MATLTQISTTDAAQLSVSNGPKPVADGRFRLIATDCDSVGNVRTTFLMWDMDRVTAQLLHDRLAAALMP